MPFILSITIKGADFIRALNLNFQPFSYTSFVQDTAISEVFAKANKNGYYVMLRMMIGYLLRIRNV